MPMPELSRVFISYSRKDGAALAQRLQTDLTKEDLDAWLDTPRIRAGAVWSTEIEREIKSCRVMIVLISPGSYGSEICRAEQNLALDQGRTDVPLHREVLTEHQVHDDKASITIRTDRATIESDRNSDSFAV